jgi:hypothetical protein
MCAVHASFLETLSLNFFCSSFAHFKGLELRQAVIDQPSAGASLWQTSRKANEQMSSIWACVCCACLAEHCLQQAIVFWEQGDRDTLSQLMPEPDFQELCMLGEKQKTESISTTPSR